MTEIFPFEEVEAFASTCQRHGRAREPHQPLGNLARIEVACQRALDRAVRAPAGQMVSILQPQWFRALTLPCAWLNEHGKGSEIDRRKSVNHVKT